jgi:hypothetical protein
MKDKERLSNGCTKKSIKSQAWWHMPIIPALRRLTHKDC